MKSDIARLNPIILLIPAFCVIIGIYPTAKVEEEILIKQFEEEYIKYKQKVGMFFPKLF